MQKTENKHSQRSVALPPLSGGVIRIGSCRQDALVLPFCLVRRQDVFRRHALTFFSFVAFRLSSSPGFLHVRLTHTLQVLSKTTMTKMVLATVATVMMGAISASWAPLSTNLFPARLASIPILLFPLNLKSPSAIFCGFSALSAFASLRFRVHQENTQVNLDG
jgi:hypothetical protein